jgi:hypothetical protein
MAARFNVAGGPIQVAIACEPNRNGSYTIFLWEVNRNTVVKEYHGNFLNTADDVHDLDLPNAQHDGRLVEGMIVVSNPPGAAPCTVSMSILQDGNRLARAEDGVPPGSAGRVVDLFIELSKS